MASKKICRMCSHENVASAAYCGMCGADFSNPSNYEMVNEYQQDINQNSSDYQDSDAQEAENNEQYNYQYYDDNSQPYEEDAYSDYIEYKQVWSTGVSKFFATVIVSLFLIVVAFSFTYIRTGVAGGLTKFFQKDKIEETVDNTPSVKTKSNASQQKKKKEGKKDFVFKNSHKRYLKTKEIKKLSKKKLAIARNEIYARAGRRFTSGKWKKYFKKKSWYKPQYSAQYFDKHEKQLLNKYERANIKKIKKIELAKQ